MNLKHNKKLCSFIFLLAFLAAQISIALHNIEHGILEHTHAGKQCEQCVFAKHYNADIPASLSVNIAFAEHKVSYTILTHNITSKKQLHSNPVRAPPGILLS